MAEDSRNKYFPYGISDSLMRRIDSAARISWKNFGRKITFYLPGMFTLYGKRGCYPAVSVTGSSCELQCKHCRGRLLKPMSSAFTADELLTLAGKWRDQCVTGILLSGGSTREGFVPLFPLLQAVPKLKEMGFFVSAHSGFATKELANALAESGVDQVLIDVVGDDETALDVLNLPDGTKRVKSALDALFDAGLSVIPHIIVGLAGEVRGEFNALKILASYPLQMLSFVVLMPAVSIGRDVEPIPIEQVVSVMVSGREMFPTVEQSLGCARPRGKYRYHLEQMALRTGINRMALWSEQSIDEAKKLGLEIQMKYTCCSVNGRM